MEDVLDGQEILANRMPGTISQEMAMPQQEPLIQIRMGLEEMGNRMEELQRFVVSVSKNGFCRCNVYKDPNCVVCRANAMIEVWNTETSIKGPVDGA
jgi:hypothetical protein